MGGAGVQGQSQISRQKHIFGVVLIFCTASIWIGGSFLAQFLVSDSGPSENYLSRGFLLTYLATSLFTLYLPLVHGKELFDEWRQKRRQQQYAAVPTAAGPNAAEVSPSKAQLNAATQATQALARKQAMIAALWASPLSFLAQYTFNISLALTNITSNTILSSTSSLFTFGLSVLLLHERFTARKLMCILACIAGTALVTLSDVEGTPAASPPPAAGSDKLNSTILIGASTAHDASPLTAASGPPTTEHHSLASPMLGDFLTVFSGALYAGYTVVMKLKMPGEEEDAQVALFFGYMGLFCTVGLAPLVVMLLAAGVINLGDIPREMYLAILVMGLLDYMLSDYLWARAVILLGPTMATISLTMEIPLAAGADLIFGHPSWPHSWVTVLMTLTGTSLILAGFLGVEMGSGAEKPPGGVHLPHDLEHQVLLAQELHTAGGGGAGARQGGGPGGGSEGGGGGGGGSRRRLASGPHGALEGSTSRGEEEQLLLHQQHYYTEGTEEEEEEEHAGVTEHVNGHQHYKQWRAAGDDGRGVNGSSSTRAWLLDTGGPGVGRSTTGGVPAAAGTTKASFDGLEDGSNRNGTTSATRPLGYSTGGVAGAQVGSSRGPPGAAWERAGIHNSRIPSSPPQLPHHLNHSVPGGGFAASRASSSAAGAPPSSSSLGILSSRLRMWMMGMTGAKDKDSGSEDGGDLGLGGGLLPTSHHHQHLSARDGDEVAGGAEGAPLLASEHGNVYRP